MAKFSPVFAAVLLFALAGVTQARGISFTNDVYSIQAGIPFTMTWTGNKGPVTITLMNGPDEDLQQVLVIACTIPLHFSLFHRGGLTRTQPDIRGPRTPGLHYLVCHPMATSSR